MGMKVFKKNFYFDDITKNKGFLINLKMYIRGVPDSEFFLHMDRILLSLTVRKKSSHFTHSLI